jgi:RimJ/RimL family protein N-acetyltransferase
MRQKDNMMLYQLSAENFHLAQPLFAGEYDLAVQSALAGESPAELYVDDPHAPQAGFLILWNQKIYLAGDPTRAAFSQACAALVKERFTPLASEEEPIACTIAFTPLSWADTLASLFAESTAHRVERQYYRIHLRAPLPPPALPAGFVLRKVDKALVEETSLRYHNYVVEEMLSEAPSVAAFLQGRFGFCLQHGQELIGWCMSEYNHDNHCELGIATAPAFRRRGLATATAQATMAYAQARGITTIGWHCWKENIPSSNLALKLGFELVEDYPVWFCRFGKKPA